MFPPLMTKPLTLGTLLVLITGAALAPSAAHATRWRSLVNRVRGSMKRVAAPSPRSTLPPAPHEARTALVARTASPLDEALREASAKRTNDGRARAPDRIPSIERLRELKRALETKKQRALELVKEYDGIKRELESSNPAGAIALKKWTELSRKREGLRAELADLAWDRRDTEAIGRSHGGYNDHRISEITNADLRDIARYEEAARAKMQQVDQELATVEKDPELIHISTAIAQATSEIRGKLKELRQPEADEPSLGPYSLARIQRQLGYLSERIGDRRPLLTTKPNPMRLVAQHKRTLLVTDVANTFHHLDLAIEEASGWVMDPVAFDTRISALVELDSLRTALPAR